MKLAISSGNTKLGNIPNVNLPPVKSCRPNVPCAVEGCYSKKAERLYPNVRDLRAKNWELWQADPDSYFEQLSQYIEEKKPGYFRFHSDGDIPSQDYLDRMITLAKQYPYTRFLAFTKQYEFDFSYLPPNLIILTSAWPTMERPTPVPIQVAWMQNNKEDRIGFAFQCHKHCDECYACWHIDSIGRDVILYKH